MIKKLCILAVWNIDNLEELLLIIVVIIIVNNYIDVKIDGLYMYIINLKDKFINTYLYQILTTFFVCRSIFTENTFIAS